MSLLAAGALLFLGAASFSQIEEQPAPRENEELKERISLLEQARSFRSDGEQMERNGDLLGALMSFKMSFALYPDPLLKQDITRLTANSPSSGSLDLQPLREAINLLEELLADTAPPEEMEAEVKVKVDVSPSGLEYAEEEVEEIVARSGEAEAPLYPAVSFPYGADGKKFQYIYGPAIASDGAIAIGESLGEGGVRIFSQNGSIMAEWGSRGRGEDGTFSYPQAMVFAHDGSLWIADGGHMVDPHIQHFSRTGDFLGKIRADSLALGQKGIYNPSHLVITDSGMIVVAGLSDIIGGVVRVLVFSPYGELLEMWEPGDISGIAAFPEDRLLVCKPQPDAGEKTLFMLLNLKGETQRAWSFYGSDAAASLGDERIRFKPKHLATDAEGRVYAYDDTEDVVWMYDGQGRFMSAAVVRPPLGIVGGMCASKGGDLVFHDRPADGVTDRPSIRVFENAFPASLALEDEMLQEILSDEDEGSGKSSVRFSPDEAIQLEMKLADLKEALRLREEADMLEIAGDVAGAAKMYRQSLALHEDSDVEALALALEERPAAVRPEAEFSPEPEDEPVPEPVIEVEPEREPVRQPAPTEEKPAVESVKPPRSPLYEVAEALERSGRRYEALMQYLEAIAVQEDEEMIAHAEELERALQQESRRAVERATELQKQGELEQALALYRESLGLYPEERIREYVKRLEEFIEEEKGLEERAARAEEVWRQAMELQKAGEYEEALAKYREGLELYHNDAVVEHIGKLEEFINSQPKPE